MRRSLTSPWSDSVEFGNRRTARLQKVDASLQRPHRCLLPSLPKAACERRSADLNPLLPYSGGGFMKRGRAPWSGVQAVPLDHLLSQSSGRGTSHKSLPVTSALV